MGIDVVFRVFIFEVVERNGRFFNIGNKFSLFFELDISGGSWIRIGSKTPWKCFASCNIDDTSHNEEYKERSFNEHDMLLNSELDPKENTGKDSKGKINLSRRYSIII